MLCLNELFGQPVIGRITLNWWGKDRIKHLDSELTASTMVLARMAGFVVAQSDLWFMVV